MNTKEEHISIFYEGQDDLIDLLATSMCSICYNTKSFIDFYILDCGICNFNKRLLEQLKDKFGNFSIEYIPIDLKQFEGLKSWRGFLDCYARLLIPELKPELNRAIYLDTDIVAFDDIKKMWDENLENFEFGAPPEIGYNQTFYNNCVINLGVAKDNVYPSAGAFLVDCKQWRAHKTTAKLLKLAAEKKENLIILNEDLFSIYYNHNNYKQLGLRYAFCDRSNAIKSTSAPQLTDEYVQNEWNNIVLQHFTPEKPWLKCKNSYFKRNIKNFNAFWFFAQMTPFYVGMQKTYLYKIKEELKLELTPKEPTIKYSLFGIPLLKIKPKENKTKYRLFGRLSFLKREVQ